MEGVFHILDMLAYKKRSYDFLYDIEELRILPKDIIGIIITMVSKDIKSQSCDEFESIFDNFDYIYEDTDTPLIIYKYLLLLHIETRESKFGLNLIMHKIQVENSEYWPYCTYINNTLSGFEIKNKIFKFSCKSNQFILYSLHEDRIDIFRIKYDKITLVELEEQNKRTFIVLRDYPKMNEF